MERRLKGFFVHANGRDYSFDELLAAAQPWLAWCKAEVADVLLIPAAQDFESLLRIFAATHSGKIFCPVSARASEFERARFSGILRHVGQSAWMPAEAPIAKSSTEISAPGSLVVFTSGTTGHPKGVILPWDKIVSASKAFQSAHGLSSSDRWLLSLPLYHIGGISVLFRAMLLDHGLIFDVEKTPQSIAHYIQAGRVSGISLVPTQLGSVLNLVTGKTDCRLLIGGAPLPQNLREKAVGVGFLVSESYGSTETCAQVVNNGAPHPGVDIGVSAEGEILVRGAMVAERYVTEAGILPVTDDLGYWHSGDLGEQNAAGTLVLSGRIKDLINSGGVKVSPVEIEGAIMSHPKVHDAVAFGVPDSHWGERVVALVVASALDESALRDFLKARLSSVKIPKEIRFVSSIPVGAAGKASRSLLADRFVLRLQ